MKHKWTSQYQLLSFCHFIEKEIRYQGRKRSHSEKEIGQERMEHKVSEMQSDTCAYSHSIINLKTLIFKVIVKSVSHKKYISIEKSNQFVIIEIKLTW